MADAGADALEFVGSHGHAQPCAADQHTVLLITAVYDFLAHLLRHIGIIGRILSAVASHILNRISLFLHESHEFIF